MRNRVKGGGAERKKERKKRASGPGPESNGHLEERRPGLQRVLPGAAASEF